MDRIIRNVLKTLVDNHYEAYLVGGYVRDYLIGIKSYDVDICTNALPKDLHRIFPNNSNSNTYGGFNLKIKNYNIDITTYRRELKYNNRKPIEIEYLNNLEEDIIRRDFTINSVCMDLNEKIIDLVDGVKDINNHKIRMLGNIKERLEEDPLRILRAIRFSSILSFDIDEDLDREIMSNYKLVNTLSNTRIKEEINKILLNKNFKQGLSLLKKYKILDLLNISYSDDITYISDISGMWSQIEFPSNFLFTKQEYSNIIKIRQIVKDGIIDNKTLYNYGLYISLVSGELLNKNKKEILKMNNKLPIRDEKDLDIRGNEIIEILNIEPSKIVSNIKKELIDNILNNKLKNKNSELRKYLMKKASN